jgi:hypothetical protein
VKSLRDRLALLKWRFWWNAAATRGWRRQGQKVQSPLEQRLLAGLERDGVASCQLEELCGDPALYSALEAEVARLLAEQAEAIEKMRATAGEKTAKKSFVYMLLGDRPRLDPASTLGRICLAEPLLRVVGAYLGLFGELRYLNVWLNFKTGAPPQRSQLWHRDRDDRRIVKGFLYLSEVGPGSGPLVYAPGTHSRGAIGAEPESFKEDGHGNNRSEDAQMAKVVPPEKWITCTGGKGRLVLVDTTGYHRGGLARDADRLLLAFMFVSPAAECPALIERMPQDEAAAHLDQKASPARAWALGLGS